MTMVSHSVTATARQVATRAAKRARVRIELAYDMPALHVVSDVVDSIWRPPPGQSTLKVDFMRALTHAGNYCAIAWDGATPLGVCLGFLSVDPPGELHSHITGVVPGSTGRQVGRALKLDQRAWALEHGLTTIGWTFDPLIRRNAFFNATRLGALPVTYLVDFYGEMNDAINAGHASDRVKVLWQLASDRVLQICAGEDLARRIGDHRGGDVLLSVGEDGGPVRSDAKPGATELLVQVPADIETLRSADPALGFSWRLQVRDALQSLMADGWSVASFTQDGYYVLRRRDEQPVRELHR